MRLLIPLAGTLALVAVCVPQGGATTPRIAAKRAEANRILNEIAVIDEGLNTVSEQYDGARLQLTALRSDLKTERASLAVAKVRYEQAEQRAARFLVWLYTANHASSLDVILGAHSLGELLQLSNAENTIGRQATLITEQTTAAKQALEAKVSQLDVDRAAAASTVRELASRRTEILHGLATRRKLLASVQAEVTRLEAAERARQARLAAEARARLAAEIAARQKAAAAAAAAAAAKRAQLAAQARAAEAAAAATPLPPAPATTTAAPATTTAGPPAARRLEPPTRRRPPVLPTVPTTTGPAPAVIAPSPVIPTADLPPGHPEAAQIALQYLGVPYLWGGATPAGFDCSGLVTYVFAQLGVDLPHFAAAQWGYGVPVRGLTAAAGRPRLLRRPRPRRDLPRRRRVHRRAAHRLVRADRHPRRALVREPLRRRPAHLSTGPLP